METRIILKNAAALRPVMAVMPTDEKNSALLAMADALESHCPEILEANQTDMRGAEGKVSAVMLDRLRLDADRVHSMAEGIRALIPLEDPVGRVLQEFTRPNGLNIQKVAVPMGVVAIIYESRPNVTADTAALCFKSGNVSVLRCGRDAYASSHAIVKALQQGLRSCGLAEELIQILDDTSHDGARELMEAVGLVDLLIPRGGAKLIRTCVENALVPCIETGTGICHVYVDESADPDMALNIIENAKTSRPSVCNAEEVLLVHKNIAASFLPRLRSRLTEEQLSKGRTPVELRLDPAAAAVIDGVPASKEDFDTEFLGYTLAVAVVPDLDAAIAHIGAHSTHHSEAIITRDAAAARRFTGAVDSAAVYVNASTRFTDGGEFGLGCEIGISTQKLHARGPMGLQELTSSKYIVTGCGQIR